MNYFTHIKLDDIILGKATIPDVIKNMVNGYEIVITEPYLVDFVFADSQVFEKVFNFTKNKLLSVHLPFYDLNLASLDIRICEHSFNSIISGLAFAEKIGAKIAVSHLGYNVKLSKNSTEKWLRQFIPLKDKIEKYAAKKGITVVWENTYEKDFYLFDEMLKAYPDTKFCLDIGHCNCFADFTAVEFINKFNNSIRHLHIHDNDGTEDSHLAPGIGTIDFAPIIEKLKTCKAETGVFELEFDRFEKSAEYIKKLFLLSL